MRLISNLSLTIEIRPPLLMNQKNTLSVLFFISYQYVFQILEVAGALTHDSFMTISFPQGEGPHVQPPTALLRY